MSVKTPVKIENKSYINYEIKVLLLFLQRIHTQKIEKLYKKANLNLSPLSGAVISLLTLKEETISQLSRKLIVSAPTLVPVIDSLESKKYIIRKKSPNDRRKNLLSLTEKGKKIALKIEEIRKNDPLVKSIGDLGPKKSADLVNLLRDIMEPIAGKKRIEEIERICKENIN